MRVLLGRGRCGLLARIQLHDARLDDDDAWGELFGGLRCDWEPCRARGFRHGLLRLVALGGVALLAVPNDVHDLLI